MRLRRLRRGGEGSEYMSTSEPSQSHTVNVRSGMRLRRLRRGGEGSKNMRLRRLRRTEGSMEEKFQPMYLGKRPSYISPIESVSIYSILFQQYFDLCTFRHHIHIVYWCFLSIFTILGIK